MPFIAHIEGKLKNDLPITQDLEAATEDEAKEQAKLYVDGLGEMLAESNVTITEKPRFENAALQEVADAIIVSAQNEGIELTQDQIDEAIHQAGDERMFGAYAQRVATAREELVREAADDLLEFLLDDGKLSR